MISYFAQVGSVTHLISMKIMLELGKVVMSKGSVTTLLGVVFKKM